MRWFKGPASVSLRMTNAFNERDLIPTWINVSPTPTHFPFMREAGGVARTQY